MTRREEQAFNDGKVAFAQGASIDSNPRRSPEQREAWRNGYEDERRRRLAAIATPAQREEARSVVQRLKDWAKEAL